MEMSKVKELESKTFEEIIKEWRDLGYTAYVRSLQNLWFIHWDDRKSVAFDGFGDEYDYEIAGFKPTEAEVKHIRETAVALKGQLLKHKMGNEYTHYENHVKKQA